MNNKLRIKAILEEKKLTQKALAEKLGWSAGTLSRTLSASNITIETIIKIATALEVPLWQIFISKEEASTGSFVTFIHHNGKNHVLTEMEMILDVLVEWNKDEFEKQCHRRDMEHMRRVHKNNLEIQRAIDILCKLLPDDATCTDLLTDNPQSENQ